MGALTTPHTLQQERTERCRLFKLPHETVMDSASALSSRCYAGSISCPVKAEAYRSGKTEDMKPVPSGIGFGTTSLFIGDFIYPEV